MNTQTYDRNVTKGLALIADETHTKVRYVSILGAATHIEDTSFKVLKLLHQAAYGIVGERKSNFNPSEWARYSEHLALNEKYNIHY